MTRKWIFLVVILIGTLLEVAGDVLFKTWANGSKRWALWAGFALYAAGSLGWAWSLKYESLSNAIVVFMVVNMLIAIAAGHLLFKEQLSPVNWAGIGLAIVSLVLCEWK